MFFNLPFMDDSSEDDVPDFLKGDTSSAFDDLFASANVPETFDDIPDFLKGDDNAFLEALGAPAGASDDTISKLIAALTPATQDRDDPNFFESLLGGLLGGKKSSGINLGQLGLGLGLASLLKDRGAFDPDIAPVGYQGEVPRYTAIREQVTGRDDTNRRPGSGGRRYFSDVIYAKAPEGQEPMSVEEARAAAKAQAAGFMGGGSVLQGGGYLQGDSDGQADLIPADIDGVQEARLSHGEFVLPADVVAMLGNGNSDAGAEALDEFMSMVRTKATGTPKQQKNIDADKVLMMLSKKAG
jgi:hypothetical protein